MAGSVKSDSLVLGLFLIALGVLWTLGNLGRIDLLAVLATWWPLTLVVWGLVELGNALLARRERRSE
jgi:hypothetical protein